MATCSECSRVFPDEHKTICLIGAVLCPLCERTQLRVPIEHLDRELLYGGIFLDDLEAQPPPEDHSDYDECCTCSMCAVLHAYQERVEAERTAMWENHISQVEDWARLPEYQLPAAV